MHLKILYFSLTLIIIIQSALFCSAVPSENSTTSSPDITAGKIELYAPISNKNLYCRTPTYTKNCKKKIECFEYREIVKVASDQEKEIIEIDCKSPSQIIQLISSADILETYISMFFEYAVGLGALFAVLRIIYGGIQVITSEQDISEGKKKIISGTIGIVFLLLSAMILHAINPNFFTINQDSSVTPDTEMKPPTRE